jgi:hypothetical protein
MRLKKKNNMGMRKTSLLKLNGIKIASNDIQNAILKIFDKGLKLGMKDPYYQVRMIRSNLTFQKGILNFWPGRIDSHGNKQVFSSKVTVNS